MLNKVRAIWTNHSDLNNRIIVSCDTFDKLLIDQNHTDNVIKLLIQSAFIFQIEEYNSLLLIYIT